MERKTLFQGDGAGINIKTLLFKYLASWPLFVISLILCVGAGIFYTRYTPPKYIAFTSFLIKGGGEEGLKGENDLIETALNGKPQINLNNEILVLKSTSLMERVVAKNNFNISYFKQGKILKTDLYLDVPFRLVPHDIKEGNGIRVKLKGLDKNGGLITYGEENNREIHFKWGSPFTIENKTFSFVSQGSIESASTGYEVTWDPIPVTAADLAGKLSVGAFDTKTSVLELSLLTENLEKGKDILNALFTEFNLADIETRNRLSENTVRFIDDRLNEISSELKGVEGNLENYRGNNQLLDVSGQSAQSLENSNDATKIIKDINIKQNVVTMISGYFNNSSNNGKLIPSSLGLDDPILATLITQYNELQLKKEREAPLVAPNSLVMQDINTQLSSLRSSIMESLSSVSKNLRMQEGNLQQQKSQYRQFLSSLPHNERVLQEIRRKQSITEGLYLYLLQKREEAAISSTSLSVSNYKQIDPAKGYGPVEPNSKNILIYSALLGLMLPIGWVYVKSLLNDKISNRDDIVKLTNIPVIGDISHITNKKGRIVMAGSRDLLGEQFRIIRTNLSVLNKNSQVILVTSSISNEGKSFASINLAAVLAIPGRKVALLQFDMRRPGKDMLNLKNDIGISQYLTGKVQTLKELYYASEELSALHVYPPGPVIDNPADLLLNENMARLFSDLRQYYDYIIIDSAPVGLVSDAFILGEYSDAVLYVTRQRHTLKKQLNFLNDIERVKKLNNIGIILNDVKTGSKYGYEGYGYGGKNGYYTNANTTNKKPFTWRRNPVEINN